MADMRLSLVLTLALSSVLAACDSVEVCRECLDGDRDLPVTVDPSQFDPIAFEAPLPDQLSNLYFDELCGIDCAEVFRFDLPGAQAERIMSEFTGAEPVDLSANDRMEMRSHMERFQRGWIIAEDLAKAQRGYSFQGAPTYPFYYLLVPQGEHTRVYLFDNSW